MIDTKQLLAKLQNDKIFISLLEQVPDNKKEEALSAIREIVDMGSSAGERLSSMASQVKNEIDPKNVSKEEVKDA